MEGIFQNTLSACSDGLQTARRQEPGTPAVATTAVFQGRVKVKGTPQEQSCLGFNPPGSPHPATLFIPGALAAASGVWPQHLRLRWKTPRCGRLRQQSAALGLDGGEASSVRRSGTVVAGRAWRHPRYRSDFHKRPETAQVLASRWARRGRGVLQKVCTPPLCWPLTRTGRALRIPWRLGRLWRAVSCLRPCPG